VAIKKILVPTDFSADASRALAYAEEFAKPNGAEITLLHVIEPIYYATPADMYVTTPNLTAILDEQRAIAKEQLAQTVARLTKQGTARRGILEVGIPAQVIVDLAQRRKVGLIVMSTHGRTGLAHMVMGSVAEKVVRTATCPVLTVRGSGTRPKAARKAARKTKKK